MRWEWDVRHVPRPSVRTAGRPNQNLLLWAALLLGTVAAGVLKWGLGFAAWL